MAQIIVGDLNDVAAVAFGRPDQTAISYIKNQFQNTTGWVGAGQQLWQNSIDTFNKWLGDDAVRAAERALRVIDNVFQDEIVMEYEDVTRMQAASVLMQSWIMTSPYLKKQAERQVINGYKETWTNGSVGCYGISDPLYRASRNGVMQWDHDDDGEECNPFWITTFDDEDDPDVPVLPSAEKLMITRTCYAAELAVRLDRLDATDPEGAEL